MQTSNVQTLLEATSVAVLTRTSTGYALVRARKILAEEAAIAKRSTIAPIVATAIGLTPVAIVKVVSLSSHLLPRPRPPFNLLNFSVLPLIFMILMCIFIVLFLVAVLVAVFCFTRAHK